MFSFSFLNLLMTDKILVASPLTPAVPWFPPDESWPLQSGSSSGELSGSGEAQAEALWWGHHLQVALVNTVAFRGIWQKQFLFTNSQNLPFILSDGTPIKVPMKYQAAEVSFGQLRTGSDQRYTVLELPFLGRSLSLQVLLPSERKTLLSSLEAQLTQRHLASWDTGLLVQDLQTLHEAWFINMDLLLVFPDSECLIPEVTEDGTKAAAATGMVLLKRSRAPVFKADRPFLFLLQQVHTGIYFTSYRSRLTLPVTNAFVHYL
uniref:Serpin peptidase inhibitor, clade E (nexin, plasminogen activator inhibitor type 1), member 3 n=1 Tax=Amphiprion percula TaxID=161767 RepID=A0A3P8RQC4_AMPPE